MKNKEYRDYGQIDTIDHQLEETEENMEKETKAFEEEGETNG